jgi:hypothetical protein
MDEPAEPRCARDDVQVHPGGWLDGRPDGRVCIQVEILAEIAE